MPDQSSAADEHALLQEITAPLATLPDDPVSVAADVDFPIVLRGYDRVAVDAYVKRTSQLVAELHATRSPDAAVRRALERVGEQISGILQRAHETAEQITSQSRRESEDRLDVAREEAAQISAAAELRLKELDTDTDRIWAERMRIVEDARQLAGELLTLAEAAAERFPAADDTGEVRAPVDAGSAAATTVFDGTPEPEEELAAEEQLAQGDAAPGIDQLDRPEAPGGLDPLSGPEAPAEPHPIDRPEAPLGGTAPVPADRPPDVADDPDPTVIMPPFERGRGREGEGGAGREDDEPTARS